MTESPIWTERAIGAEITRFSERARKQKEPKL